eukprot:Skav209555  [mRNA]  locus=scaffold2497:402057:402491:- [translate_table: standard]
MCPLQSLDSSWKKCRLGRFTGGSPHGSGAAFAFGILAAELALLPSAAMALVVHAGGHCLFLGGFAHLRGVHGVVVLITAGGNLLRILTAQLALLTTTSLAAGLHTALGIFFPGTLQTLSSIQTITGILGFQFRLSILAHLGWVH